MTFFQIPHAVTDYQSKVTNLIELRQSQQKIKDEYDDLIHRELDDIQNYVQNYFVNLFSPFFLQDGNYAYIFKHSPYSTNTPVVIQGLQQKSYLFFCYPKYRSDIKISDTSSSLDNQPLLCTVYFDHCELSSEISIETILDNWDFIISTLNKALDTMIQVELEQCKQSILNKQEKNQLIQSFYETYCSNPSSTQ